MFKSFRKDKSFFDYFVVLYLTLLHLPPFGFHCVGGFWDRTQDFGNCQPDALTTRLDLLYLEKMITYLVLFFRNDPPTIIGLLVTVHVLLFLWHVIRDNLQDTLPGSVKLVPVGSVADPDPHGSASF